MALSDFYIPWNFEDLLRKGRSNSYYVSETYDESEIRTKLDEFQEGLNRNGAVELVEWFDVFYSGVKIFSELDDRLRSELWEALIVVHGLHYNELQSLLSEDISADRAPYADTLKEHHNIIQMNVYLLSQIVEKMERNFSIGEANANLASKGRKGRRGGRQDPDSASSAFSWVEQKIRLLQTLRETLCLPLNLLWNPPIVDDQFTNCVANICYKIFENPEAAKSRAQTDDCIEILALLLKRYRYQSVVAIKVIQQLQHFEHLSVVWATGVSKFVELGFPQIVLEIFRELSNIELDDATREGASARNYATFLVDLGEKCPDAVLANISLLMCHLDVDCYTMRNAVLTIFAQFLSQKLKGEHLDVKERQLRDRCLDFLETHLHDKNAFVRGKCFQLWTKLCEQGCIPKNRLKTLLPLVIGRLLDKASTVRKGAIQLLTLILRSNPFMATLSLPDVKQKYESEAAKLAEMQNIDRREAKIIEEHEIIRRADQRWEELQGYVVEALDLYLNDRYDHQTKSISCHSAFVGSVNSVVMLKSVFDMISSGQYQEACAFAVLARYTWPEHRNFQNGIPPDQPFASQEEAKTTMLEILKTIFLEHTVALQDTPKQAEGAKTSEEDKDSASSSTGSQSAATDSSELDRQKKLVNYLSDCKFFAEQLESVLPRISCMLAQQQTSDVLESIEFVVTCAEFGVADSAQAVWKCCSLICSKDQAIRAGVIKAFQRLYLSADANTVQRKDHKVFIVSRLIDLVIKANASQRTSLEDVMCELTKQKLVSTDIVHIMWEKFRGRNMCEKKGALKLIGMVAKAQKSIIKENFELLVSHGLGQHADFELVRDLCVALEKLGYFEKSKDEDMFKQEPFRLESDNNVFKRLIEILVEGFTSIDDANWTPMMERIIKVIFLLANKPDRLAADILKQTYDRLQSIEEVSYPHLARFVSLIGQIALQTFVFVDVAVCRELKRRSIIEEEHKKKASPLKSTRKSLPKTPRSTVTKVTAADDDEMGLAGATAEDAELEFVNKVCEDEILAENTILGKMAELVISICKQQHKYKNEQLQCAATLALSKIMLISPKFCELHLPLFFTILQKSESPAVRANLTIAISDLAFRFPNLLEPWSSSVYKRLNDQDLNVRLNCLLILNYLILNDMIKPKGNVADLAVCTLDECAQVSSLAKKFFAEYSEKGNSLYNLLPDIISRLSDSECDLKPEDFKSVMKFLFSLIHKERQFESLVEKLCQRFQATRSMSQWRYFAFCLSLISFNEKCLNKLVENLSCYANQLGDAEIFGYFISILTTCKKSVKVDNKEEMIEELERRFTDLHEKHAAGIDENELPLSNVRESARRRSKLRRFAQ